MYRKITLATIVASFIFTLVLPAVTFARHTSYSEVNTSSLGSKIVKEFPIPILFGLEYEEIRSDFGDPRGGGTRQHEGQDLFGLRGTPIVSPTKAVVSAVGSGESAGNFVYTANPGGETFRYMHLDTIADIKRGDKLAIGDFIGTVGDTGNAVGTTPHLHFEIRKDGKPLDPYTRLEDEFTFKEKISFLDDVIENSDDEGDMIDFLVDTYSAELQQALNLDYPLPRTLQKALAKAGVVSNASLQSKLDALIASIPKLLQNDLQLGSQGTEVALLQIYLSYTLKTEAGTALRSSGATGYFGPVTESAVRSYQQVEKLEVTGVFDAETRHHQP